MRRGGPSRPVRRRPRNRRRASRVSPARDDHSRRRPATRRIGGHVARLEGRTVHRRPVVRGCVRPTPRCGPDRREGLGHCMSRGAGAHPRRGGARSGDHVRVRASGRQGRSPRALSPLVGIPCSRPRVRLKPTVEVVDVPDAARREGADRLREVAVRGRQLAEPGAAHAKQSGGFVHSSERVRARTSNPHAPYTPQDADDHGFGPSPRRWARGRRAGTPSPTGPRPSR